ncbi:hypothetical protein [Persicobacter sp. CCB-QB2]|uniref:hypothetical protein n=1 Tax=Persicobacter sp. CCB-QB2 TaxID=1561025 RepID=UPI0006A94C7E|nr:hypothetical protein [Persicobacter sp. CCB-QB2]
MKKISLLILPLVLFFACSNDDEGTPIVVATGEIISLENPNGSSFDIEYSTDGEGDFVLKVYLSLPGEGVPVLFSETLTAGNQRKTIINANIKEATNYFCQIEATSSSGQVSVSNVESITTLANDFTIFLNKIDEQSFEINFDDTPPVVVNPYFSFDGQSFIPYTTYQITSAKIHTGQSMFFKYITGQGQESNIIIIDENDFDRLTAISDKTEQNITTNDFTAVLELLEDNQTLIQVDAEGDKSFSLQISAEDSDLQDLLGSDEFEVFVSNASNKLSGSFTDGVNSYVVETSGLFPNDFRIVNSEEKITFSAIIALKNENQNDDVLFYEQLTFAVNKVD